MIKLGNQLCFPLYVASRIMTKAYQPLLDNMDITYPQYLVLMVLWEKDNQPVNTIAQKLFLNTNTITPLLQRMEKQGIIKRKKSKEDSRKVLVSLTESGATLKDKAYCIPEEMLKKLDISLDDIKGLKDMLDLIIYNLSKK